MDTFSLIPGTRPVNPGPLARFLPPLEDGVISTWLANNIEPGSWLLDPFGNAPRLSLETARAGYRVLVAANNPITRFILEMGTASYPESEYKAAIADLAVSRKGEERLEDHLQELYRTACTSCTREVPAQAFLWRKGEAAPYGRVFECRECGESGENTVTPKDVERAAEIAKTAGLARARGSLAKRHGLACQQRIHRPGQLGHRPRQRFRDARPAIRPGDLLDAYPTDFCIGAAGYPEKHFESPNLKFDLDILKRDPDRPQFLDRVLRGLRLQFAGRRDVGRHFAAVPERVVVEELGRSLGSRLTISVEPDT